MGHGAITQGKLSMVPQRGMRHLLCELIPLTLKNAAAFICEFFFVVSMETWAVKLLLATLLHITL
jgi:hypothetical protein